MRLFAERESCHLVEFFPWSQNRAREAWLVRGIGIVLCFEAEGFVGFESSVAWFAIEEVSGVELDTGLSGFDAQSPTASWIDNFRGIAKLTRFSFDNEAVVVSVCFLELSDSFTDFVRGGEIQWGACNWGESTFRNHRLIDRKILVAGEGKFVLMNGSRSGTAQVEISVVGEVQDGWLIGGGLKIEGQAVVVIPTIFGDGGQRTWVTFFSIGTDVGEFQTYRVVCFDFGD